MATETQPPYGGWTFETLKRYLEARIEAQKERSDIVQGAADRAVQKAELAMNERLAGMNELRQAMQDISKLQLPRNEYNVQHANLMEKIEAVANRVTSVENLSRGRSEGLSGIAVVITVVFAVIASLTNVVLFFVHFK